MDKPVYSFNFFKSFVGIFLLIMGPGLFWAYTAGLVYDKYWNNQDWENVEFIAVVLIGMSIYLIWAMDYDLKIFKDRIQIKKVFGWSKQVILFEEIESIFFKPKLGIMVNKHEKQNVFLKVSSIPKVLILLHQLGLNIELELGDSKKWKKKLAIILRD